MASNKARRDWDRLLVTALLTLPIPVVWALLGDDLISKTFGRADTAHPVVANSGLLPTALGTGAAAVSVGPGSWPS
jgi:hypothetical protein